MMPPYPIVCYRVGCGRPAEYKIAARWSDGITGELKTYSLCCAHCLPICYRESKQRQDRCRCAPGETLEPPGIYAMARGLRDRQLQRVPELETELSG